MLSVIVPIYNIERYLPKCIESIIHQTYENMEIILVDDGSTDSCGEICDFYATIDKRIVVSHETNGGLVRARKRGLERANGEYIAFVDGDDWVEKDMYKELIDALERTNASFVDSGHFLENQEMCTVRRVQSDCYALDNERKHLLYMNLLNLDDAVVMYPSIWSKVFKQDLIKQSYVKVPDDRQYGEDVINLLYCIAGADSVCQVKQVYYHYVCREGSISRLKSVEQIRKYYDLWKCGSELINQLDVLSDVCEIEKSLLNRMRAELIVWGDTAAEIPRYFFPKMELLFGKKTVIYGAGKVGRDYVAQIAKYTNCEIVCWVDKQYQRYQYAYREVLDVDSIRSVQYDNILLAVKDYQIAEEIREELIGMQVPAEKIIWVKPENLY